VEISDAWVLHRDCRRPRSCTGGRCAPSIARSNSPASAFGIPLQYIPVPGYLLVLAVMAYKRQTTCPILKIGRYIATTSPPMTTPRTTMISGSISDDRLSTASSTSRS
jgi:hypothetical protein